MKFKITKPPTDSKGNHLSVGDVVFDPYNEDYGPISKFIGHRTLMFRTFKTKHSVRLIYCSKVTLLKGKQNEKEKVCDEVSEAKKKKFFIKRTIKK